jgi:hypothetical protein
VQNLRQRNDRRRKLRWRLRSMHHRDGRIMKLEWTDKKNKTPQCAHCKSTDELTQELSTQIKCVVCKKDHYIELYYCKCGEHYYQYQPQHLLRQRAGE